MEKKIINVLSKDFINKYKKNLSSFSVTENATNTKAVFYEYDGFVYFVAPLRADAIKVTNIKLNEHEEDDMFDIQIEYTNEYNGTYLTSLINTTEKETTKLYEQVQDSKKVWEQEKKFIFQSIVKNNNKTSISVLTDTDSFDQLTLNNSNPNTETQNTEIEKEQTKTNNIDLNAYKTNDNELTADFIKKHKDEIEIMYINYQNNLDDNNKKVFDEYTSLQLKTNKPLKFYKYKDNLYLEGLTKNSEGKEEKSYQKVVYLASRETNNSNLTDRDVVVFTLNNANQKSKNNIPNCKVLSIEPVYKEVVAESRTQKIGTGFNTLTEAENEAEILEVININSADVINQEKIKQAIEIARNHQNQEVAVLPEQNLTINKNEDNSGADSSSGSNISTVQQTLTQNFESPIKKNNNDTTSDNSSQFNLEESINSANEKLKKENLADIIEKSRMTLKNKSVIQSSPLHNIAPDQTTLSNFDNSSNDKQNTSITSPNIQKAVAEENLTPTTSDKLNTNKNTNKKPANNKIANADGITHKDVVNALGPTEKDLEKQKKDEKSKENEKAKKEANSQKPQQKKSGPKGKEIKVWDDITKPFSKPVLQSLGVILLSFSLFGVFTPFGVVLALLVAGMMIVYPDAIVKTGEKIVKFFGKVINGAMGVYKQRKDLKKVQTLMEEANPKNVYGLSKKEQEYEDKRNKEIAKSNKKRKNKQSKYARGNFDLGINANYTPVNYVNKNSTTIKTGKGGQQMLSGMIKKSKDKDTTKEYLNSLDKLADEEIAKRKLTQVKILQQKKQLQETNKLTQVSPIENSKFKSDKTNSKTTVKQNDEMNL